MNHPSRSILALLFLSSVTFAQNRPETQDTYSDNTRALDDAKKAGATTTKVGGSTLPSSDDSTGGTGLAPEPPSSVRSAKEELRTSGTASTGGTGTTVDEAGDGTMSNTTGTGSMGSASGQKPKHVEQSSHH